MRGRTRLHTNQAGRLFLEEGQHLTPPQLTTEEHGAIGVNAMDLEDGLRKINTYRDNFAHGRLLFPRGSAKPQLWHLDACGWEPSTASEADAREQFFSCVVGASYARLTWITDGSVIRYDFVRRTIALTRLNSGIACAGIDTDEDSIRQRH
jgi:hypothetical protein